MNLKETFKKQGGIKLLKQYWQGGALFTGIGQFLLLGKSRTALEILRLSTTLKTKQKLEKKYKWKLEEFDKTYIEKEHKTSDTIWICWFQGMDNAPDLVKKCYHSVVKNNPEKKVIVLTEKKYKRLRDISRVHCDKVEAGSYYAYAHDRLAEIRVADYLWWPVVGCNGAMHRNCTEIFF